MPLIDFPTMELGVRVFDPIVTQVTYGLLEKLRIRNYFSNGIYIKSDMRSISTTTDGDGNRNIYRNRCNVNAKTILNPMNSPWPDQYIPRNNANFGVANSYRGEHSLIFQDPLSGVDIHERTKPAAVELDFEIQFQTIDAANWAFQSIVNNSNGDLITGVHDIVYSYPLGAHILDVLNKIYLCKDSYKATGRSFYQYLVDYGKQKIQFDTNRLEIGRPDARQQLVVKRIQLQCPGLLEMTQDAPEPVYVEKLPSMYKISFTYKVQFGRPDCLQLYTPIVIENTLLDSTIFSSGAPYTACWDVEGQLINGTFTAVEQYLAAEGRQIRNIRIPDYDDFNMPPTAWQAKRSFDPLITSAVLLDEGDETVFYLNQLDDLVLHPILLDLLSQMTADDLFGFDGILSLCLYANGRPIDRSLVDYDPTTYKVTLKCKLKVKRYHFVLAEARDMQFIHPKWYNFILKYRWYYPLLIMRRIGMLIGCGFYSVTPDPDIVILIKSLKKNGRLNDILRMMVSNGDTNNWIFQYATYPTFFADYLTNTRSLLGLNGTDIDALTPASLHDVQEATGRTLMQAFIEAGKTLGYINQDYVTQGYLRTPKGYPYGPNQGGFHGFTTPLRVFYTEFVVKHPLI